jgi:hypothetical protein
MHPAIPARSANVQQNPWGMPPKFDSDVVIPSDFIVRTGAHPANHPAQVSNQSTSPNQNQVEGLLTPVNPSAQTSKPTPPPNQDQAFGRGHNLGRYKTPVAGNPSYRSGSPIHGANTRVGSPPSENGKISSLQMPASPPVSKTLPRNGPVREGPGTPESQKTVRVLSSLPNE